ncbi:MAG: hypothetical protein JOZ18_20715, partial [Chloroflexi bacterium]|nr:hypothetical protein [Chloroflexota bacterium]
MTPASKSLPQKQLAAASGLMALGIWQLRLVWRLFILVSVGMIAAVMLVCSLPLFALVSTTSTVRNTFNNGLFDPTSYVQMEATVASSAEIVRTTSAITQEYRQIGGNLFSSPPVLSLRVPYSYIVHDNQLIPNHVMQLHGYDDAHITSHLPLLQGHLPQTNGSSLEIALSESNALSLHAHLGSTYTIYIYPSATGQPLPIQLTVVGIFQDVSFLDPFWHRDSFISLYDPIHHLTQDQAVISNAALLRLYDNWRQKAGGEAIRFLTPMNYYVPLDIAAVNSINLDTLPQLLEKLSFSLPQVVNRNTEQNFTVSNSDLLTMINAARDQSSVVQIPVLLLQLLMLGLILFFTHIMTELLVTRQAEAVAMARTRGATLPQVFLIFVSQSLLLGLLTLLLTPVLLMLFIHLPVQIILSGADQQALNVLPTTPWRFALLLGWYPIVSVVVGVAAMCAAIWRTLT